MIFFFLLSALLFELHNVQLLIQWSNQKEEEKKKRKKWKCPEDLTESTMRSPILLSFLME